MMTTETTETETPAIESETGPTQTAEGQALLAIRCLYFQMDRDKEKLLAARKRWAEALKEATGTINELMRQPVPGAGATCKERLRELKDLDSAKQEIEVKKVAEIESLKQKIAQAETALFEILRRDGAGSQETLNFRGSEATIDPRAGILVTNDHVATIQSAAELYQSEHGEDPVDGMAELNERLEALGCADLELPDVGGMGDGEPADGDDEESEDAGPIH